MGQFWFGRTWDEATRAQLWHQAIPRKAKAVEGGVGTKKPRELPLPPLYKEASTPPSLSHTPHKGSLSLSPSLVFYSLVLR
jgi:hypothetical protein